MGRFRDNAPVSHTCPKIDDVINTLNEIYISEEPISRGELASIESTMEKIRKDNSALRDWGNEEYERAEENEKDRDYYKDLAEKYENEISDLKQEIRELHENV